MTKRFTSTVVRQLRDEGKLSLSDPLNKYFSENQLRGLHTFKWRDLTAEIRVIHLISHTSGLPDYFM